MASKSFDITSMASLKKHAGNKLGKALAKAMKGVKVGEFFGDSKWNPQSSAMWVIKTSADAQRTIEGNILDEIKGDNLDTVIMGKKIRFLRTKKTLKGVKETKGSIEEQERAQLWIIKRAINDNKKYSKWQDIPRDGKYRELVELYPDIDDVWLQALWAQNSKMYQIYSSAQFSEWSRGGSKGSVSFGDKSESGFMDFITELIKVKHGISQKDTWNPADIWMVKNQPRREKELKQACEGKLATLMELNEVMKGQFKKKQVIGISLKKISGKVAKWEEVNVDDVMFEEMNDYNFEIDRIRMMLGPKSSTNKVFATLDTILFLKETGGAFKFKFQVKSNSGTKPGNQKIEGTLPAAAAARAGKAIQDITRPLFKEFGMTFQNQWTSYPQNPVAFNKEFDKHYKRFEFIYKHVESGIKKTKKDFRDAMMNSWADAKYARCGVPQDKLMQIHFVHDLFKLSKKKREDLLTDLVFISMKVGKRFGPFGKLY